jgi:acetyl-CoA carboxylase carboxyltransferase component
VSWKEEVEGIELRAQLAKLHGGEDAVARQHAQGRLTIRERIDALLDPGSFREQGPLAGQSRSDPERGLQFTPANYVLGLGRIDGRPVVVGGEDFTLRGGSPSPAGLRKSVFAEDLALRYRLPLIRLLEGGGGSVSRSDGPRHPGESAQPRPASGESDGTASAPPRFLSLANALGAIPVASAALGAVAGFPAARLAASHFAAMARGSAQVLIAGPALVERALRVDASKEELGGAAIHLRSGVVDAAADDEPGTLALLRRFLGYLPPNVWERAPLRSCEDPRDRQEPELLEIVPRDRRKPYRMRRILELVLDRGSFFELGAAFGSSQITGLARILGQPVGVLASDPHYYAGALTAEGAQKLRRFVDLCDTFHLPIASFVDEPGFMIGPDAERAATIRHGMAAICAVVQSSVPWISVVVRKLYGVAGAAHFGPGALRLAWPSAESGALPIEGGVAVAYRREIAAAPDPEAFRRELEERIASQRSPFSGAEAFSSHDLIDPRKTRPRLCDWVEWIQPQLDAQRGPRSYTLRP